MATDTTYIQWYFRRKATEGFQSEADLLSTVGSRPEGFTLTRTNPKEVGMPLTRDNFVWITQRAIAQAKVGILEPPQFPPNARTPQEQALNDQRFALYTHGMIEYAKAQQEKHERRKKLEEDYRLLMVSITDYVVSKGYSELDAMNPEILSDKPKLQAARQKALDLMAVYTNANQTKEKKAASLKRLNDYNVKKREEAKQVASHNRVYTGKKGRPFERWLKRKVLVSSLTEAQREQHGIPPMADHVYLLNTKTGRKTKRHFIEILIPNPRAPNLPFNPSIPEANLPPTPPITSDTSP